MYLLDANVFIEAKNRHYAFEFCPAFWHWLDASHTAGRVSSVQAVGSELRAGADELADWARDREGFFAAPDDRVPVHLARLSVWVTSQDYTQAAVSEFLQSADYLLIGHAAATGQTVVTHEILQNTRRRVKIPNACQGIGVPHATPYAMLRNEGAQFVLGPQRPDGTGTR